MDLNKRVLGIDENGLGPIMGPLVVTGTLLRQSGTGWFEDISDSKSFFPQRSADNFSRMEETVISIFYLWQKKFPSSPAEILNSFCGKPACLSGEDICSGSIPENFVWASPEKAKRRCGDLSEWAVKNGVLIENIRSFYICTKRINDFVGRGDTKLLLDFLTYCGIVKEVPDKKGLAVHAGKIGGLKFYVRYLRYGLPDYQADILEEKEELSLYAMKKDRTEFRLGFFMDVEQKSFPAALSSIAGKYVREVIMAGIRKKLGIKENISGYRDGKTKRYIASLSFEKFPVDCILRRK